MYLGSVEQGSKSFEFVVEPYVAQVLVGVDELVNSRGIDLAAHVAARRFQPRGIPALREGGVEQATSVQA